MSTHRKTRSRSPFAPRLELLEARDVPSVLTVDDTGRHHADFQTIQAAVDAAHPGDTILVYPGTYKEQVTFAADKDNITLRAVGGGKQGAVITAPATLSGTHALIHVNGATGDVIDGFTVEGPSADLDAGIVVDHGGSAVITDNVVKDIRSDPLSGVQTGFGIVIGGLTVSDGDGSGFVAGNTVTGYQKGGVWVVGSTSKAVVDDNTVTGAGPTDVIAQNGIEVSEGASAVVTRNTVSGNFYTPTDTEATGILVDTAGRVLVAGNRLSKDEVGVAVTGDNKAVFVTDNRISDSQEFGVWLVGTSGAVVTGNRITGSKIDGIRVEDTTDSTVSRNRVSGSGEDGIHVTGASSGNTFTGNDLRGNTRFDAFDDTTGSGTAGTADTWTGNRGKTSSPAGLVSANGNNNDNHHGHGDHDDDGGGDCDD